MLLTPCLCFLVKANKRSISCLLVEAAQALAESAVVKDSLLEAIRDGRVLYLYLNADEQKETYAVGDSILHMGGAESTAFLSCFYNLYRMNRVCLPRM